MGASRSAERLPERLPCRVSGIFRETVRVKRRTPGFLTALRESTSPVTIHIHSAQVGETPLTTVHQPLREMGARAVQLLMEQIEARLRAELSSPFLRCRPCCTSFPTGTGQVGKGSRSPLGCSSPGGGVYGRSPCLFANR